MKCTNCAADSFRLLYTKKGFDIVKCTQCDLVRTNIPPDVHLNEIYNEDYFAGGQDDGYLNYEQSEKALRSEFRRTVSFLRRLTGYKTGLRLLEVGSAYGFLLDEAKPYFDCCGIEVSAGAADFSQKRGHRTVCGIADEPTLKTLGTFDVIVMLDVIEHLPDPSETVRLLQRSLNPGGYLLTVTGDINTPLPKLTGKHWRLMTPPQHTHFFSKKTLSETVARSGFEVVLADRPWKFVPLGLAFYQVCARVGLKMRIPEAFNRTGFLVNLFDTVRVVGQKKAV